MAIYFISDFHLGSNDAKTESLKLELFAKFIQKERSEIEHLVVLGDLYDFWFEYKHLIPKCNLEILYSLRNLVKQGKKVSYISGNHDFWLGDFMETELGFQMVDDQLEIPTDQGKILAIHGDGLAKSDWKYRILKKILRNKFNIALYKLLPPSLAYSLALKVSHSSRNYTSERTKATFLPEYELYAKQKLDDGYFAFICGHTHYPQLKRFGEKYYINSGDWINHFTYVKFSDGEFQLLNMLDD